MQVLPQRFVCNSPIPKIHITSECYRSQLVVDKETKFLSGSEEHMHAHMDWGVLSLAFRNA